MRPSAASALSRSRIQRMPSGSRPLAGSSRISTRGSPSMRGGDAEPLPHAQRVALELALRRRGQPDQVEHLVGPLVGQPGRGADHPQVVAAGAALVRAGRLQHRADRAAAGRSGRRSAGRRWWRCRRSGVTRLSSMRSVVVLPAPFGPRKPVTRPGCDRERQVVHGPDLLVLLGQAGDDDLSVVWASLPVGHRSPPVCRRRGPPWHSVTARGNKVIRHGRYVVPPSRGGGDRPLRTTARVSGRSRWPGPRPSSDPSGPYRVVCTSALRPRRASAPRSTTHSSPGSGSASTATAIRPSTYGRPRREHRPAARAVQRRPDRRRADLARAPGTARRSGRPAAGRGRSAARPARSGPQT